jgi:GntR family transcriptional regulator/MocR family aminotransferase
VDLPLVLERTAGRSLNEQLTLQLRAAMREGRLTAGERLPSSRAMAASLGVSRTVVMEAYSQLYAEGWLDGRHGSGTYVAQIVTVESWRVPHPDPQLVRETPRVDGVDLRPGVPWVAALDTPAWRRAWRRAAEVPPAARPDPLGLPGLRAELGAYMRRSRGVAAAPDQIMVTRGATSGLDLLVAAVLRPGDRVGVEEPGYARARSILRARGAQLVPCPVDEHGLIVDALPGDLTMVYTTPSHQYPLGGVLPMPRRQALVAWAARTGALIVEDDYDGEFRYDVAPLPALYGLDPGRVVYLGTTAKTLAPDVGVGWLVARPELVEAISVRRLELSDRTPVVPQEAVRLLLARGDLDRHVRRMRAEYARRRAVTVAALSGLPLWGDTAGLHVVVELAQEAEERVAAQAAERGVLLDSLTRHYAGEPTMHGLVIGYAGAGPAEIRTGCALVREWAPARADGRPPGGPGPVARGSASSGSPPAASPVR